MDIEPDENTDDDLPLPCVLDPGFDDWDGSLPPWFPDPVDQEI